MLKDRNMQSIRR